MQLRSKNLYFNALSSKDYPLFCSVFSDESVMRYAYHDATDNAAELREKFDKILSETGLPAASRPIYMYMVSEARSGAFIGIADIVIEFWQSERCGEIGYFLLPEFWGKGYASEIACTLVDTFFARMGLHRICATCNAENKGSERVMQKAGMTLEGVLRKARYKQGVWHDELRYSILRCEWHKNKA